MTNDFLAKDKSEAYEQLKQELYQRLADCRRNAEVFVPYDDEFGKGIDCRLANEIWWLEQTLDRIERS